MTKNVVKYFTPALAAVIACTAAPAFAQDGWIRLFDGETLFGFNSIGDTPWTVKGGEIVNEGGTGGMLATTSRFHDFELTARIKVSGGNTAGLAVRASTEGHPSENGSAVIPLVDDEKWHDIKVTAQKNSIKATIDGKAVDGVSGSLDSGVIAILLHRRGNKIAVSDLRLRPLDMAPLFNGKNLDGWNVIPGRKSEFSVVDGALNIKNGNGQIETAGLYKDFVLQLSIISNGEHLNSGVFFRGPAGVFWKGYESQVRNEWRGDDRAKPVDFGTGGIYGVQETRKVVSSDHEWFEKTVVCEGNHVAVWIDGYQVSDFTDTRPVNENYDAKAGYVPYAGTIHLQGHDPTTDLSFKNINIQVYPE